MLAGESEPSSCKNTVKSHLLSGNGQIWKHKIDRPDLILNYCYEFKN